MPSPYRAGMGFCADARGGVEAYDRPVPDNISRWENEGGALADPAWMTAAPREADPKTDPPAQSAAAARIDAATVARATPAARPTPSSS